MLIDIDTKLLNQIDEYCSLNGIEKDKFIYGLLNKQFLIEKYGERPGSNNSIKEDIIDNLTKFLQIYKNFLLKDMNDLIILPITNENQITESSNIEEIEFDNGVVMVNIDKPKIKRKRQLK